MTPTDWAREGALYNKWQNAVLLERCDALDHRALTADRGLAHGSILATLDQVVLAEMTLMDFAESGLAPVRADPGARRHLDYVSFRPVRVWLDDALVARFAGDCDAWLREAVRIPAGGANRARTLPRVMLFMQLFNHATHHRAQVTAELHRLGLDAAPIDLAANPLSAAR